MLPFDEISGKRAAAIRCALEFEGTPIGLADTFLAGHALAQNAIVVTDNESEFRRIKGIKLENWRKP